MPWIAFVDEELSKELDKINGDDKTEEVFPEHEFLGSCLRIGLTISDLKEITYVDVMKIFITFIGSKKSPGAREATQKDIDKLLG